MAERVKGLGGEIFTRAGFTGNQYGDIALGHFGNTFINPLHGRPDTD